MPSMADAGGEHGRLDDVVAALWEEARPRTLERVATLEDAVASLMMGELDAASLDAARREAHKLAGALGTFGMPDGSTRARAIQLRLAGGAGADEADELAADVAALRAIVEAGPGAA